MSPVRPCAHAHDRPVPGFGPRSDGSCRCMVARGATGPRAWRSGPASWSSRTTRHSSDSPGGRWRGSRRAGLEPPDGRDPLPRGRARDAAATSVTRRMVEVDVCTVLVNEMARRNLLHEMGHIWIDQNVSPERCAIGSSSSAACGPGTLRRTIGRSAATSRAPRSWRGRSEQVLDRTDPRQRSGAARSRLRAPDRRASGMHDAVRSPTLILTRPRGPGCPPLLAWKARGAEGGGHGRQADPPTSTVASSRTCWWRGLPA